MVQVQASKIKMALVIEPRFSGGTSSAVAREIRVLAPLVDLTVYAIGTKMFQGTTVNPHIAAALLDTGLELHWDPKVVRSDVVALHNNACLKFNTTLSTRIVCDRLFVITHENFLRPNGEPGFDITTTLLLLERASVCKARFLVPVSPTNRKGVEGWLHHHPRPWVVASFDWFNICDFEHLPPTTTPQDRRGRLSRPGFEKFPPLSNMHHHFPAHADAVHILGGDSFLMDPNTVPAHWTILPFGAMPVAAFLEQIDFFVYYTHPQWRESFGRVLAEAIAAGKVVITDPGTAAIFGDAVVASEGQDIDAIIASFVQHPERYASFVRNAQSILTRFGSAAFAEHLLHHLERTRNTDHALL